MTASPVPPEGLTDEEPKFGPEREFGSRTEPFTEANLAKARKTLEKFQKMHWLADYPCERANGGHKAPCLPVDDVEWLFGYIDALTERATFWQMTHEEATEVAGEKIASLTAQVESLTTERDEIVRNVREELVDLGFCWGLDPECPGTFCHFTTLIANYEQGSPDE